MAAPTTYFELEIASPEDQEGLVRPLWRPTTRERLALHLRCVIVCGLAAVVFVVVWASSGLSTPRIGPSNWVPQWHYTATRRIAIFQHFNLHNDRIRKLQRLSKSHHQRYAHFWGYDYRSSTDQFVPEVNTTIRQRQMNKVYGLLQMALDEIAKGDQGAEWIHITDADVLIADPSVPLHALLPSDDNKSEQVRALIVGSEDGNGFNSGNMIYRCDLQLVAYLAHTIAISDDITKEYDQFMTDVEVGREPEDIETPPSDQRALCLTLEQYESFSSRFYQYPQNWLNSYDVRKPTSNGIQLHTHLVAGRKYRAEYDEYEAAEQRGWDWIHSRTGIQMEERVQEVKGIAQEHWNTAKVGLPKCIWV